MFNRDGKKPWSYLTHLLSGRIRTWRHNRKFKGEGGVKVKKEDESMTSSSEEEQQPPSYLLKKVEEQEGGELIKNLSNEDFFSCIKECQKLVDKKQMKRQDIKTLLKKTFPNRREEIRKLEKDGQPMMSSVMVDWTCFQYGEFVSITILCLYKFA